MHDCSIIDLFIILEELHALIYLINPTLMDSKLLTVRSIAYMYNNRQKPHALDEFINCYPRFASC